MLDGVGQQLVEGQRDRDRLGLGQHQRPALAGHLDLDRAAEGALHRLRDRPHDLPTRSGPPAPTCRP
jgi:hypothetical protein